LLEATRGEPWAGAKLPVLSVLTYSQNVLMAISGKTRSAWLLPTWTLCVEEQFYLLLPIVIYLTPKAHLRTAIISLILSASLFRIVIALTISDRNSLDLAEHVLLPSRWDLLFCGVLAAQAARSRETWEKLIAHDFRVLKLIVLSSIAVLPALAFLDKVTGWMSFDQFASLAIGTAFAAFILLIVGGAREAVRFRAKPLPFFGQISYCLYLIHQPVAGLMHGVILGRAPDIGTPAQFAVTLAAIGISVGIACVSWRYFERPLILIGHGWRYRHKASPAFYGTQAR
jgi:peptidoglycan/LPS O-acetylase OafA/YrhL